MSRVVMAGGGTAGRIGVHVETLRRDHSCVQADIAMQQLEHLEHSH